MILLDGGRIRYDGDLQTMRSRLDRPCVEISFATAEAAARAAKVLDAGIAPADSVSLSDHTVRCILEHGTRQGTVLGELEHMLGDIVSVHDVERPLRDLLAEIYGANSTAPSRSREELRKERREQEGRQASATVTGTIARDPAVGPGAEGDTMTTTTRPIDQQRRGKARHEPGRAPG